MNAYLTSPVTPIVAGVVAVAIVIAIFTKVASKRRKEREREAWAAAQRVKAQEALDRLRAREVEERRSRVIRGLEQASAKVRRKAAPTRRASVPTAPTRRDSNDDGLFIPSLLATDMFYSDPTPSRDDSGPSHSSNHSSDSGGYSGGSDSGSSSGGDSGGSSGGGGGE